MNLAQRDYLTNKRLLIIIIARPIINNVKFIFIVFI